MILIACEPCQLCIRVMGDAEEIEHLVGTRSDFWQERNYRCPICEQRSVAYLEREVDPRVYGFSRLVDLNPQEAFSAFMGLGLPEEGDCRKEVVEELLRTKKVKTVKGKNIPGTNRCRLDFVELEDGARLYFGAGAEGAVVYRVMLPPSYREKVDGGG